MWCCDCDACKFCFLDGCMRLSKFSNQHSPKNVPTMYNLNVSTMLHIFLLRSLQPCTKNQHQHELFKLVGILRISYLDRSQSVQNQVHRTHRQAHTREDCMYLSVIFLTIVHPQKVYQIRTIIRDEKSDLELSVGFLRNVGFLCTVACYLHLLACSPMEYSSLPPDIVLKIPKFLVMV